MAVNLALTLGGLGVIPRSVVRSSIQVQHTLRFEDVPLKRNNTMVAPGVDAVEIPARVFASLRARKTVLTMENTGSINTPLALEEIQSYQVQLENTTGGTLSTWLADGRFNGDRHRFVLHGTSNGDVSILFRNPDTGSINFRTLEFTRPELFFDMQFMNASGKKGWRVIGRFL